MIFLFHFLLRVVTISGDDLELTCTSEFCKDLKLETVPKTRATGGRWKPHECIVIRIHEKPHYYKLIVCRKVLETTVVFSVIRKR
jgi:hypothetical protein